MIINCTGQTLTIMSGGSDPAACGLAVSNSDLAIVQSIL